jgi:hypothetical protein
MLPKIDEHVCPFTCNALEQAWARFDLCKTTLFLALDRQNREIDLHFNPHPPPPLTLDEHLTAIMDAMQPTHIPVTTN